MAMHETDLRYMRRALALAEKGLGWTSPNPMVGAVIVRDGQVLGEGYHHRCGEIHAERDALANCRTDPSGATLYVTLEPCCHTGRQPPCTEAILAAGITRVVTGAGDPNPLVNGGGIRILRSHGVQVETGVLEEECSTLNRVFFHFVRTGRPYVTLKYAMTLDGKIATRTGASRWITGEEARAQVHRDRHRNMAILTGIGTVLADNPLLTCRMEGGRNPVRIVCDSHLETPLDSLLVRTAGEVPVILATAETHAEQQAAYEEAGCRVWQLPDETGHVHLPSLMERLGREQIDSVLLEGGGTLNQAALEAGIVQHVQAYIAPKLFGGAEAPSPVEGTGVALPEQAIQLTGMTLTRLGADVLLEGDICVHGNH